VTNEASPAEVSRQILVQLLEDGPRYGAQLRPSLERELIRRGILPQAVFGPFQRFGAFLSANADLLEIIWPHGPGDVRVSLRSRGHAETTSSESSVLALAPRLKKDVWQAFTNPDLRRRRFIHRQSGEIVHYVEGSTQSPNPEIAARVRSDASYVEVEFAPPELQSAWMKEFLNSAVSIPDWTRRTAEHFTGVPYESSLNTAFITALGEPLGEAWRTFRSTKVFAHVKSWADRCSVPMALLLPGYALTSPLPGTISEDKTAEQLQDSEMRAVLHAAIDAASNVDLGRVSIPAGVFVRLLRRRQ
jgi:hypothetical protein